jgi:hypothetical protein
VSKLGGERLAHERCQGALVIRVSGLFGSDEYGARGKRPRYSVIAHDALAALGIAESRACDAAPAAYLAERARSASRFAPAPDAEAPPNMREKVYCSALRLESYD